MSRCLALHRWPWLETIAAALENLEPVVDYASLSLADERWSAYSRIQFAKHYGRYRILQPVYPNWVPSQVQQKMLARLKHHGEAELVVASTSNAKQQQRAVKEQRDESSQPRPTNDDLLESMSLQVALSLLYTTLCEREARSNELPPPSFECANAFTYATRCLCNMHKSTQLNSRGSQGKGGE